MDETLFNRPPQVNAGCFGGCFLAILGLIFIAIGLFVRQQTLDQLSRSVLTEAVVVELVPTRGSEGNTLYAPRFRFTLENGETVYAESATSTNPPAHRVGDVVRIYYERDNPLNVKVDSFADLWLFPTLFIAFGGIAALSGIGGFVIAVVKLGGLAALLVWFAARRRSS
ncbi:MAG: DUF3592 domain-containing protein [Anaerolineae bacterium]|nr:DUF3592 domain-containing protein [Anaerolineae bacterium]